VGKAPEDSPESKSDLNLADSAAFSVLPRGRPAKRAGPEGSFGPPFQFRQPGPTIEKAIVIRPGGECDYPVRGGMSNQRYHAEELCDSSP
jgi:hypothetical protein